MLRALLPSGAQAVERGRDVLRRLDLVRLNDRLLNAAGGVLPNELRSLDAIHLGTVHLLGDDLRAIVTCDDRMARAAAQMGYQVVRPT